MGIKTSASTRRYSTMIFVREWGNGEWVNEQVQVSMALTLPITIIFLLFLPNSKFQTLNPNSAVHCALYTCCKISSSFKVHWLKKTQNSKHHNFQLRYKFSCFLQHWKKIDTSSKYMYYIIIHYPQHIEAHLRQSHSRSS